MPATTTQLQQLISFTQDKDPIDCKQTMLLESGKFLVFSACIRFKFQTV